MNEFLFLFTLLAVVLLGMLVAVHRRSLASFHLPAIVLAAALPAAASLMAAARHVVTGFNATATPGGGGREGIHGTVSGSQRILRDGTYASVALLVLGLGVALATAAAGRGELPAAPDQPPPADRDAAGRGLILLVSSSLCLVGVLLLVVLERRTLRLVKYVLEPGASMDILAGASRRIGLQLGVATLGGLVLCLMMFALVIALALTRPPQLASSVLRIGPRALAAVALLGFLACAIGLRADSATSLPAGGDVPAAPRATAERADQNQMYFLHRGQMVRRSARGPRATKIGRSFS